MNRCPFVRFGRCHFWHPEHECVQQPAETAETASVVSTAETISTPHASAPGLLERGLGGCIDGKIKLQAAELQELEDARQRAWISECAAVTDKLSRIQEPEQPEEVSVCAMWRRTHGWR